MLKRNSKRIVLLVVVLCVCLFVYENRESTIVFYMEPTQATFTTSEAYDEVNIEIEDRVLTGKVTSKDFPYKIWNSIMVPKGFSKLSIDQNNDSESTYLFIWRDVHYVMISHIQGEICVYNTGELILYQ